VIFLEKQAIGAGTRYFARLLEQNVGRRLDPRELRTLQRFLGNRQLDQGNDFLRLRTLRRMMQNGLLPGNPDTLPSNLFERVLGGRQRSQPVQRLLGRESDFDVLRQTGLDQRQQAIDNLQQRLAAQRAAVTPITPSSSVDIPVEPRGRSTQRGAVLEPPSIQGQPLSPDETLFGSEAKPTGPYGSDQDILDNYQPPQVKPSLFSLKDILGSIKRNPKSTAAIVGSGATGAGIGFFNDGNTIPPITEDSPFRSIMEKLRSSPLADIGTNIHNKFQQLTPNQRMLLGAVSSSVGTAALMSMLNKNSASADDITVDDVRDAALTGSGTALGLASGLSAGAPISDLRKTYLDYKEAKNLKGFGFDDYSPRVGDIFLTDDVSVIDGIADAKLKGIKNSMPWLSFLQGSPGQTHASMIVEGLDGKPAEFVPGFAATSELSYRPINSRVISPVTFAALKSGLGLDQFKVTRSLMQRRNKGLNLDVLRQALSNPRNSIQLLREAINQDIETYGKVKEFVDRIEGPNHRPTAGALRHGINKALQGDVDYTVKQLKNPAYTSFVYRPIEELSDQDLAQMRKNMSNAVGTSISTLRMPVTFLRNILGLSSDKNNPAVCAGGICRVMDGVRDMPASDNALPKDLRHLPGYELIARSDLPANYRKALLRSGLTMAAMRSAKPLALAGSAAGLIGLGMRSDKPDVKEIVRKLRE
jgi:hypothetical protein